MYWVTTSFVVVIVEILSSCQGTFSRIRDPATTKENHFEESEISALKIAAFIFTQKHWRHLVSRRREEMKGRRNAAWQQGRMKCPLEAGYYTCL